MTDKTFADQQDNARRAVAMRYSFRITGVPAIGKIPDVPEFDVVAFVKRARLPVTDRFSDHEAAWSWLWADFAREYLPPLLRQAG